MGYTTEFIGKFTFNREPSQELKDYINCFAKTRHVKSDDRLDMTGFYQRNGIVDDIITLRSRNRVYGAIGL